MFAFLKDSFFPETNCCHQTEFPRQVSHNFCLKLGQSESRGQGRHWHPPDFGRSVNPISTRARQIRPSTFRLIPPDFQTFLRPWIRCGIKSNHYHYHETKNYWQHPAECMLLLFTRVGHNFEQKQVCVYSVLYLKRKSHILVPFFIKHGFLLILKISFMSFMLMNFRFCFLFQILASD